MTSEKLRALAHGVEMRQATATPVFLRALACALRAYAEDVALLEQATLGHEATAERGPNVVSLPLKKRLPIDPLFPTGGSAA